QYPVHLLSWPFFFFFLMIRPSPRPTLFPYTTLFRSLQISTLVFPITSMLAVGLSYTVREVARPLRHPHRVFRALVANFVLVPLLDRKSTRLNSSHVKISYAVFCLKKKK